VNSATCGKLDPWPGAHCVRPSMCSITCRHSRTRSWIGPSSGLAPTVTTHGASVARTCGTVRCSKRSEPNLGEAGSPPPRLDRLRGRLVTGLGTEEGPSPESPFQRDSRLAVRNARQTVRVTTPRSTAERRWPSVLPWRCRHSDRLDLLRASHRCSEQ